MRTVSPASPSPAAAARMPAASLGRGVRRAPIPRRGDPRGPRPRGRPARAGAREPAPCRPRRARCHGARQGGSARPGRPRARIWTASPTRAPSSARDGRPATTTTRPAPASPRARARASGSTSSSVLVTPKARAAARHELVEAARAAKDLDPARARDVRVIEYEVTDRDGGDELIALVTTITDPLEAPAAALASAYHQRWEHETANAQLKTFLRGPGRVLRSESPDMIEQEIWGYLLTHHAISALICTAATSAGIDPDRVKFKRTIRAVRRRVADPAFSP